MESPEPSRRPRQTSEKGQVTSEREGGEEGGGSAWVLPLCELLAPGAHKPVPGGWAQGPSSSLSLALLSRLCDSGQVSSYLWASVFSSAKWKVVVDSNPTLCLLFSLIHLSSDWLCAWAPLPAGFLLGRTHSKEIRGKEK